MSKLNQPGDRHIVGKVKNISRPATTLQPPKPVLKAPLEITNPTEETKISIEQTLKNNPFFSEVDAFLKAGNIEAAMDLIIIHKLRLPDEQMKLAANLCLQRFLQIVETTPEEAPPPQAPHDLHIWLKRCVNFFRAAKYRHGIWIAAETLAQANREIESNILATMVLLNE